MLCHYEYIFGSRRWGAGAGGCDLLRSSVVSCEFFFVAKVSILKVGDEIGEGREVHGNAADGRKDGGVVIGGKCSIGQDSGGVRAGAKAFEQKFRAREQLKQEGNYRME